jgi:uncharacterized membrane protein YebE (DUF533 family)
MGIVLLGSLILLGYLGYVQFTQLRSRNIAQKAKAAQEQEAAQEAAQEEAAQEEAAQVLMSREVRNPVIIRPSATTMRMVPDMRAAPHIVALPAATAPAAPSVTPTSFIRHTIRCYLPHCVAIRVVLR